MPLPDAVRSDLSSVPALDRGRDPPRLKTGSSPSVEDLSYSQLRYSRGDEIGSGGNEVVYRASLEDRGLDVALKRPFPDHTVGRATVDRILAEGETWARVDDHPYVAGILGWGNDAVPWVAIEYLDGGTLADRIDEFGVDQRLWTAYAIADAVAYASGQRGVTHHDLKPENVLFRRIPDGGWDVPKIADWGLSRELARHSGSLSQATPAYAAPEQRDAFAPDTPVGVHTDVYQLGVLCYELLTGEHPNHLDGDVPPPSRVDGAVPPAVDETILAALAHDRDDRPEHPILFRNELEDALGETLDGDDPATSEPSSSDEWAQPQGGPGHARYRSGVAGPRDAASVRWTYRTGSPGRTTAPIVVGGTLYVTGSTDLHAVDAASGAGRWTYHVDEPRVGGPVYAEGTIYAGSEHGVSAIDAADGTERWARETEESAFSIPTITDDAVYIGSSTVHSMNPETGTERWTVDVDQVLVWAVADDERLYLHGSGGAVHTLAADDGTEQWATSTGETRRSPALAGDTLYVASKNTVHAVEANTGHTRWTHRIPSECKLSPTTDGDSLYVGGEERIYALDATTGDRRWVHDVQTGRPGDCSALTDDTLYVATKDVERQESTIYALDAATGDQRWSWRTDDFFAPGAAVADGRLFVSNGDRVVALAEP